METGGRFLQASRLESLQARRFWELLLELAALWEMVLEAHGAEGLEVAGQQVEGPAGQKVLGVATGIGCPIEDGARRQGAAGQQVDPFSSVTTKHNFANSVYTFELFFHRSLQLYHRFVL